MSYLLIFILTALLDFVWSRYSVANISGTAAAASHWALAITLLSGVITILFVHDPSMLVPACLGAWVGTYIAKQTNGVKNAKTK